MQVETKSGFSGSVLVKYKGKVLLSRGYGLADKENNVQNTENTRFMIGSITKQFTSMAIMQLEEKGMLSVNDHVEKYIPNFPYGKEITIHQLLSHTSGLPRDITLNVMPSSMQEALNLVMSKGFDLVSRPGNAFNYSNAGYQLLGLIIEKVTGESYEKYIQKNIFDQLGMNNSGFGYNRNKNPKLAKSYDFSGNIVSKEAYVDCSIFPYSAGDIYSTIGDLYKWDKALYSNKLVSIKTLNKIFEPVQDNYGYGWVIDTPGYKGINWHNGLFLGFSSYEFRIGKSDACYIILSNNNCTSLESIMNNLSFEIEY